ncbi:ferritin-like domain-containing protein [Paraliomyxa miuraensis]|uniref:ferritin-like domain-containing protein n=1 Tax=Paraliomyxa miuraensis TaxID=376150 RepID=UPI00224CE334|nr:ferritin-like domain-containing protein [Paraliomyxa miuraensis]MCX4239464.1 ferritin-like domain-containing protein [Paraliomyxa miuraensis]
MLLGVDGLRVRIAAALGLAPLLVVGSTACVTRTIEDLDDAGEGGESSGSTSDDPSSTGSTTNTSVASSVGTSVGPTTATVTTVTTVDPGDTGPQPVCVSTGDYYEWEIWWPPTPAGECVCDEECQYVAVDQWYDANCCDSCWYVFGDVLCTEPLGDACRFIVTMREDGCGEGRPLLIDGRARTAELQELGDHAWGSARDWARFEARPRIDELRPTQRRMLAERWARSALAEHASVASFARFVLDLSAMGAPPELLSEAAAAMQDEIRHAQVAFALASAYAGHPMGPGPLPMRGLSAGGDPETIVRMAIREGCIEETLAAAEAELAAHRATDPAVRQALSAIAEDEARHAVLAWRFVDWAVRSDPSLASAVREEMLRAMELADAAESDDVEHELGDGTSPEDEELASAHGVVPERLRRQLRAQCLRNTIRPCAFAMLQGRRDNDSAWPS